MGQLLNSYKPLRYSYEETGCLSRQVRNQEMETVFKDPIPIKSEGPDDLIAGFAYYYFLICFRQPHLKEEKIKY